MNTLRILITLLLLNAACTAQEDSALAKTTTLKIQGKWQQTAQSKINGDKSPGKDVLILKKDLTYTWTKPGEKKKTSGKWKIDNYGQHSNTGKMMELLVLETKSTDKKTSIFINELSDSSLVLRVYDYSEGATSKDRFTDLHFKKAK